MINIKEIIQTSIQIHFEHPERVGMWTPELTMVARVIYKIGALATRIKIKTTAEMELKDKIIGS